MKSKRNLMTVLVGLAMLATPITAAAKDHKNGGGNFSRPAARFNAPSNHPFRNRTVFVPAPVVRDDPHWDKWDKHEWKHDRENDRDADDYVGYGRGGYYGGPAYYGAPAYVGGYGGGYGGGGSCAKARQIQTVYQQDRYRGHPAAAADVLRQNQWAFRSGCGGVGPIGGGGLFNGFGGGSGFNGFGGAPAYNNYGGGYGGYNGGYGQPYGGYNSGYGQPYGGGLGGLLQQFVH